MLQLTNTDDIATLEQTIRSLYACDVNVPCAALNSASYYIFRRACEDDIHNFQQTDISVTLPWPCVRLTMAKGFVTVIPQQPFHFIHPEKFGICQDEVEIDTSGESKAIRKHGAIASALDITDRQSSKKSRLECGQRGQYTRT